jgi:hypothetical protein
MAERLTLDYYNILLDGRLHRVVCVLDNGKVRYSAGTTMEDISPTAELND